MSFKPLGQLPVIDLLRERSAVHCGCTKVAVGLQMRMTNSQFCLYITSLPLSLICSSFFIFLLSSAHRPPMVWKLLGRTLEIIDLSRRRCIQTRKRHVTWWTRANAVDRLLNRQLCQPLFEPSVCLSLHCGLMPHSGRPLRPGFSLADLNCWK